MQGLNESWRPIQSEAPNLFFNSRPSNGGDENDVDRYGWDVQDRVEDAVHNVLIAHFSRTLEGDAKRWLKDSHENTRNEARIDC